MSHRAPDPEEYAALMRLLRLAGNDTPAARCAADFLLAWWDAPACGGFDFTALWQLAPHQREDALRVCAYLARAGHGPQPLGLAEEMQALWRLWRRGGGPDEADRAGRQGN